MSRRSAPFVAPDYINDPISKDGKKHAKVLLSALQEDIASFRDAQFPPDILRQIRDMPIYEGNLAEVQAYQQRWQTLLERAMAFYPAANLPPDYLPLPASLEIPQLIDLLSLLATANDGDHVLYYGVTLYIKSPD